MKNIILIIADQLRYDVIGETKKYPVHTPNLDALCRDGYFFNRGYTQSPVCAPARTAILSGKIPEKSGAIANPGLFPERFLLPEDFNFVKTLRQNGYETRHFGKWGITDRFSPCEYGFDSHVSFAEYGKKYPSEKSTLSGVEYFKDCRPDTSPSPSVGEWLAENAAENIKTADRPFYMQIEFSETHVPFIPKEKYYNMYKDLKIDPPYSFMNEKFINKPYIQKQQMYSWNIENDGFDVFAERLRCYFALVTQLDAAVGMITGALKEKGLYNDTIIIFTADHGEMCGSHRMHEKHYVMYDDVVRVPFILKGTENEHKSFGDALVNASLDIAPTLFSLCGIETPDGAGLDGKSLAPLLTGETGEGAFREFLCASYNGAQFGLYTQRMIIKDNIKYIWNLTDVDELYDLEKDGYECENLVYDEKYADILKGRRRELYCELERLGDRLCVNAWCENQLLNNKIY